jgi:hypothetical protein
MFDKRCVLCSTTNKKNSKLICDECLFIKEFIIKFGRESMKSAVNLFYTKNSNYHHIPPPELSYSAPNLHLQEPSAPAYSQVACRSCMNPNCSCRTRSNSMR